MSYDAIEQYDIFSGEGAQLTLTYCFFVLPSLNKTIFWKLQAKAFD